MHGTRSVEPLEWELRFLIFEIVLCFWSLRSYEGNARRVLLLSEIRVSGCLAQFNILIAYLLFFLILASLLTSYSQLECSLPSRCS